MQCIFFFFKLHILLTFNSRLLVGRLHIGALCVCDSEKSCFLFHQRPHKREKQKEAHQRSVKKTAVVGSTQKHLGALKHSHKCSKSLVTASRRQHSKSEHKVAAFRISVCVSLQ